MIRSAPAAAAQRWPLCHPVAPWMTVKITTAVFHARKGGSEQGVRRKKQIKAAREITAFGSLCTWKKMQQYLSKLKPGLLFDAEIPVLGFPADILVHVGKEVDMWIYLLHSWQFPRQEGTYTFISSDLVT